ncbi:ABC transporter substrate-binding protein [Oceanisphaera arctica]|nr:ABC transporter substrate-binding protein [Oceanisphaera arctica]GHA09364.1 ABC transporter substrate-binding protein [Oceanisphaera arctica]
MNMKMIALAAATMMTTGAVTAKEWKQVRIAVEGAYPPYSWTTTEGELKGFDIDMANALCEEMQVKCTMVTQEWDGMIPSLLARKFDAIVASMSITEERKLKVDFTDKYYQISSRFVAKQGTEFSFDKAGLKGKSVGVQGSSTHEKYVADNFEGVDVKRYGSPENAFLDLISGRVDLVFNNIPAIESGLLEKENGGDFAFTGPLITDKEWFGEGVGIAVRKQDDALREKFNDAIKAIRSNGVYQQIQDKYFEFDIYGG